MHALILSSVFLIVWSKAIITVNSLSLMEMKILCHTQRKLLFFHLTLILDFLELTLIFVKFYLMQFSMCLLFFLFHLSVIDNYVFL